MNIIKLVVFLILAFSSQSHALTTYCLRLSEVSNDGNNMVVRIEIQGNEAFKLGSSNLQFSFNQLALGNPSLESSPLGPPVYQIPTVTVPEPGQVSFNIELGFPDFGLPISDNSGWTILGQVTFEVINSNLAENLTWSYNGGSTQTIVFLDDEDTQIFATSPDGDCLIPIQTILPTNLLQFDAVAKSNHIELNWISTIERNFKGYELERSIDGVVFEKIKWTQAQGGIFENDYTYKDYSVIKGIRYYYRLKMIDIDNSYKNSNIETAILSSQIDISVFPNPSEGQFMINLKSDKIEQVNIQLTDLLGQVLIAEKPVILMGQVITNIDCSNLPNGIYLLQVYGTTTFYQEEIVLMK